MDALLHGAIQADGGPVALPTQHWGNDELEAIRVARLQLAAAQQLTRFFRVAADGVLCWVSCKASRKYRTMYVERQCNSDRMCRL